MDDEEVEAKGKDEDADEVEDTGVTFKHVMLLLFPPVVPPVKTIHWCKPRRAWVNHELV